MKRMPLSARLRGERYRFALVLLLLLIAAVFSARAVYGQCTSGSVCVPQETVNKAAQAAAELIEARNVIQQFQRERGASEAERAAAQKVIEGLNNLVLTKDRIEAEQNKIIALYQQVITMQQVIIDKLEKRLNAPRTGWQKFLRVLERVADIAAGVAIGRVL